MSEVYQGTIIFVGLIITALGCFLYMLGGRSGKWKRRFVGSLLCSTAVWVEALMFGKFAPLQLLAYPLLIGAFVLGYSPDLPLLTKIIKRFIIVIASLCVGGLLAYTIQGRAWLILPLQALIASGSVWLGIKNPVYAPVEEFFICLLLTECNLLYPLVK